MKILAIGNSFSQDAVRYLHNISRADGEYFYVTDLVIGGCPLSTHFRNIKGNEKAYSFEHNGDYTGFQLSINEALLSRDWDVVTIQQVSHLSFDYSTYQPYLNFCTNYIRENCPGAKLYLHQTWSYENGNTPLTERTPFANTDEMFSRIRESYNMALTDSGADGIIPSGEVMLNLMHKGFNVHRDGFHASFGFARYALGLVWYSYLTGKSIDNIDFSFFDVPVTKEEIAAAKKAVNEVLGR